MNDEDITAFRPAPAPSTPARAPRIWRGVLIASIVLLLFVLVTACTATALIHSLSDVGTNGLTISIDDQTLQFPSINATHGTAAVAAALVAVFVVVPLAVLVALLAAAFAIGVALIVVLLVAAAACSPLLLLGVLLWLVLRRGRGAPRAA